MIPITLFCLFVVCLIGFMIGPPREALRSLAYPYYACQQCVGQEWWQGCYCSYYGAFSPDDPNGTLIQRAARKLYDRIYPKKN